MCAAGVYRCRARIGSGPEVQTSIELLLAERATGSPFEPQASRCTDEPGADYRPEMALTPRTVAFETGKEVRVVCSVWSASGAPTVQWSGPGGRPVEQSDAAIPAEEERDAFDQVFDGGQSVSAARAAATRASCAYKRAKELRIARADENTAGTYTCTAYNADGQQRSLSVDLQLTSTGAPTLCAPLVSRANLNSNSNSNCCAQSSTRCSNCATWPIDPVSGGETASTLRACRSS